MYADLQMLRAGKSMKKLLQQHPLILFAIVTMIYLLAIPVDIMEIDSAQYAHMAREMLDRKDFLHVYDRGADYLDKPPFIFWITALFYSIFGVNEFAFKFPSILFSLLGIYATFRFARLYYSRETAITAALILATTQGYFHFNNDVRTDTYLTNSVIAAVWLISEHLRNPRWYRWVGGFVFIGIAMLAKGPMGIMAPALAFSTQFLLQRSWKQFFRWEWLAGIGVILLVLLPMLVGLYQQFDQHPEVVVNGKKGVSGLRFFFWEQSFGRITGENVWKNDTGPLFFVHSIAWSFLPWTVLLFAATWDLFLGLFRKGRIGLRERPEWLSAGGFILPFIALSASQYKLPHYIYVVFPFAAVLTADFFLRATRSIRWINQLQIIILAGCWLFAGVIFLWFFPVTHILPAITGLTGLGLFVWSLFHRFETGAGKFMVMSLVSSFTINILLALHFYPSVLEYQAAGHIGKYIKQSGITPEKVFLYGAAGRSLDVYTHHVIKELSREGIDSALARHDTLYVYTDRKGKDELQPAGYRLQVKQERDDYPVTLLTVNFGNPVTRNQVVGKRYLLELSR